MNSVLVFSPFLIQALLILIDEFYFHHRRGLPKWEKIGHPLDTVLTLLCYIFLLRMPYTEHHMNLYIALCAVSCVFITKDEWVHSEMCVPAENWIHSMLFVLHPMVFLSAGYLWVQGIENEFLIVQASLMALFLLYQVFYWNFYLQEAPINNHLYHELGDRWYTAFDDPVALLMAESKLKNPWVMEQIQAHARIGTDPCKILDVGCGAGFLSNFLATQGCDVTGVDLSAESLEVAKKYDETKLVKYLISDAGRLPFADHTFEVITAMDFLEHVEVPEKIIQELSRVLKPNGLFIYHTFNRNLLSYFIIIKFVEWLVKNTPKNMHVLRLFITPKEMNQYCLKAQMVTMQNVGIRPIFSTIPLANFFTGIVPKGLQFKLTKNLWLSYLGVARKEPQ
jgi:2-polyprenyl-6-hydroxyphenyl methylase/3-demethylubiquinone-9 3-methyltransferase